MSLAELSGFQMGNGSRSTYLLFEKLHRLDLAAGQLARQGKRIDNLDQTGFLGPGQDGVLADETVSGCHVKDVDERMDFGGHHVDRDVTESF